MVLKDGEPAFASEDGDKAMEDADELFERERKATAEEYGMVEGETHEPWEIDFQTGLDGGYCRAEYCDGLTREKALEEDGDWEFSDGTEASLGDIAAVLDE